MKIIDGHKGEYHISSQQIADANAALWGAGDYVLNIGSKFGATVLNNNTVTLDDGVLMIQGRRAGTDYGTQDTLTFANGTQGAARHDLVAARYTRDPVSDNQEAIGWVVIQGEPDGGDPEIVTGDMRLGAIKHEMPLYRVVFEGIALVRIEPMYTLYDDAQRKARFLDAHPVNSIYETIAADENTPAKMTAKWGGEWQLFGAGRGTVCVDTADTLFNTANKTGGSKDSVVVAHAHTGGSHTHTSAVHAHASAAHSHTSSWHVHTMGAHQHVLAPHQHGLSIVDRMAVVGNLGSNKVANGSTTSNPYVIDRQAVFSNLSWNTDNTPYGTTTDYGGSGATDGTSPPDTGMTTPGATGLTMPDATGSAGNVATSSNGVSGVNANVPPYITVWRYLRAA